MIKDNKKIRAMLRVGLFSLITFCACTPISGMAASTAELQQAQRVFTQLASQSMVRANFIQQKQIASVNKIFKSTGQVVFAKNVGVLWNIQSPVQADLIMTEYALVQKTANTQNKITLDKSQYAAVANVFLQLMSGNQKTLLQNFDLQSVQMGQGAMATWQIRLTPKSAMLKKLFQQVEASGGQYVQRIVIHEKSNSITTIQFNQQRNQPQQLSSSENALFQLAK
ncbi:LolA family protein [Acinetobacter qingfengensis]|uniref:Outer membrane lipoprotein carrier protein LolA n=1 Tax=Acinetobacter qingfengensis TaxID=1262585 RepID=A0A1E7R2T8_9GAMM|nr:outer membrane lipoprotein carrier protein LolA [Acinetobacter qingfengensis]OEY93630.1 hypothetical protein BJI46_04090 [Acinetobacter qingfengensis]